MILRILLTCLFYLSSVLYEVNAEILPSYSCGIGPVTKVVSYVLSLPCGREKLNKCCEKHDRCYERNHHAEDLVLKTCDTDFEECIEWSYKKQSWICAKYLEFTHSGAVRIFSGIYRNLFGIDPTDNTMFTDNDSQNNNETRNVVIRADRHNNTTEIELQ